MDIIKNRTCDISIQQDRCLSMSIVMAPIILCSVTLTCLSFFPQSYVKLQVASDFYPVKIQIVNKAEIECDLQRDWIGHYPDPIDEDSRYLLYVLEELEQRRTHLLEVFNIEFRNDGDLPGIVINRIRYPIPDRFYEVPHTYALLEHVESYMFHHLALIKWEAKKKSIRDDWRIQEWVNRVDFLLALQVKGENASFVFDEYEYYDYLAYEDIDFLLINDKKVTFKSVGYVASPLIYPPKPKPKGPVFGFMLWKKSLTR
jgi:hypothetical protein